VSQTVQNKLSLDSRQLEVSEGRLKQTEAALDVMGKLHDLLENLSENTTEDPKPKKR